MFWVCLLMRTRRGVSLAQAYLINVDRAATATGFRVPRPVSSSLRVSACSAPQIGPQWIKIPRPTQWCSLSYDSAIIIAPAAGGSAKRGKLPSITKMALW
jgi:hypothetical protein